MKSFIALALCIACTTLVQSNFVHHGLGALHYRDPYVYNGLASDASKTKLPNVAPYIRSASCGCGGTCSACKGVYEHGCGGCGTCSSCRGVYEHGCGGCGTCSSCRGVYEPVVKHGCGGCGTCSSCRSHAVPSCGGCGSCSACKNVHPVVYNHLY